ncbi:glycosyltransferase family 4 protein [Pricia sp. S334]|uniref:Glycosyltransferase family 4 protein n=1 Tax=Pricia mediterranea TaxID=3076079 RepID=A0ABU3LAT6_9FLAO|nr:glycosyltransferase family 4 protein [Pricia sp. S334]MDT7830202.1 glycosyltransferase family 4 protein [Pricia sp. S334]
MNKKKIAFITHGMQSGGSERVISILSNSLSKYFEVFIIIMIDSPSFYELRPEVTLLHCKEGPKPSKGIFEALKSNFNTYKAILKYLRDEKIDLAIGFLTTNNILTTLAAKRLEKPVIISERNNPLAQTATIGFFWKTLRRLLYPRADVLTVQTSRVKAFYTSFVKEQKLVTIPNPINPEFDRTISVKKKNVILNVGSLENQKGQDILIRAFYEAQLQNWQLHIVGEGSQRDKLTELIKKLNLQESVFLLGKKSNIAEYYSSSKIFAFSSRYEGFPNALLEAMYFGLGCVSTNCPTGPAEMIENNVNGYLVDVDDIPALAIQLQNLAKNDDLRRNLGLVARKSVEKYETEEIVAKWKNLIERLLNQTN